VGLLRLPRRRPVRAQDAGSEQVRVAGGAAGGDGIAMMAPRRPFAGLTVLVVRSTMGPMSTDGSIAQAISQMVDRIVRGFHPEQVILFGSHARGSATP